MGNAEFVRDVLAVFAEADDYESLLWRVRGDDVWFSAQCSDFFHWASADAEPIEPDDLPLLRETFADLAAVKGEPTFLLAHLFAARKRGMRPMRLYLQQTLDAVVALFLACGPERDPGTEG